MFGWGNYCKCGLSFSFSVLPFSVLLFSYISFIISFILGSKQTVELIENLMTSSVNNDDESTD